MKLEKIVDSQQMHSCFWVEQQAQTGMLSLHGNKELLEGGWPCIAAHTAAHTKLAAKVKMHFRSQYCFGMLGSQEHSCFVSAGKTVLVITYEPHAACLQYW